MEKCRYDAVFLGINELARVDVKFKGKSDLKDIKKRFNKQLITTKPRIIKKGKFRIGIFGIYTITNNNQNLNAREINEIANQINSVTNKIRIKSNFIISVYYGDYIDLHSIFKQCKEVNLIILGCSKLIRKTETVNDKLLTFSGSYGRFLSVVNLQFKQNTQIQIDSTKIITIRTSLPEKKWVKELIDETVRQDPDIYALNTCKVKFVNEYKGSAICARCHPQEHDSWKSGPHANAFKSLVRLNQYNNPDCLDCHTLSKGLFDEESNIYAGVHCEACHSGLEVHIANQFKFPKDVELKTCFNCHSNFDEIRQLFSGSLNGFHKNLVESLKTQTADAE